MRLPTFHRGLAALVTTTLAALAAAPGATAQAPPAGLGEQLFSTGGDITIEVKPATAGLTSELRLFAPDGTYTSIASNHDVGRIVMLAARPNGEELVFGITIAVPSGDTYKMGPGERNPDGLAHAVVRQLGERQYQVGFEDLRNGGDRDYGRR